MSKAQKYRRSYQASDVLNVAIVVAAAVQGILFAVFLARTIVLRPFSDMIWWINFYLQERQHHVGLLEYLWAPHNEHHMAIIRLLTALDVSTFHASGVPFVIAATTALVASALLIFLELHRDRHLSGPLRSLALLGPMLLLTSSAAVDCSIPINSVYPLALVCIIAALVLFDGEAERSRLTAAKRAAAVVVAMLASLSNAVGFVVWPALLWVAWRGGAALRWLLAIAAVGICYGLIYIHSVPSIEFNNPNHLIGFAHLMKMAEYLLAYLGLPLSRASELRLPALALGSAMVVAGSVVIVREALLRRPATRLRRMAIGWGIVTLAAALLAAVGRVDVEAGVKVPVRYALLVAPLHIGLLALALPFLAKCATTPRRQAALLVTAVVFAAGLLTLQVVVGRAATANAAIIATMIDRYNAGIREPEMEKLILPDLAVADRVMEALHQFVATGQ